MSWDYAFCHSFHIAVWKYQTCIVMKYPSHCLLTVLYAWDLVTHWVHQEWMEQQVNVIIHGYIYKLKTKCREAFINIKYAWKHSTTNCYDHSLATCWPKNNLKKLFLMPRSHIPVRHPVWYRFSTNDRTSIKRHETGQNYSKCHLWAISANLLPYTHRQWGSHGAGMAFITHPWCKHSGRTLSQSRMNHVSPHQPTPFAIPPRTSPVNPDINPLENDCATSTTHMVMTKYIFSTEKIVFQWEIYLL